MAGNTPTKKKVAFNPYKKAAMPLAPKAQPKVVSKKKVTPFNPYKKRWKIFAIKVKMPLAPKPKPKVSKKLSSKKRWTTAKKGQICNSFEEADMVYKADRLIWKSPFSVATTTTGNVKLTTMVTDLQRMGYFRSHLHEGTHHSCKDAKKAFWHTMNVWDNAIHDMEPAEKKKVEHFLATTPDDDDVKDPIYVETLEGIVTKVLEKLASYEIYSPRPPLRQATPHAIYFRLQLIQKARKKMCLSDYYVDDEPLDWSKLQLKGQTTLLDW